jgi:hypothetical protein
MNKNVFFSKMENRKVKQVLSRGLYQWKLEGDYGENIMFSCMKMEK